MGIGMHASGVAGDLIINGSSTAPHHPWISGCKFYWRYQPSAKLDCRYR